jgi:hypothetical protein
MQNIEALKELLRMAHEQLDIQTAKNAELEKAVKQANQYAQQVLDACMFTPTSLEANNLEHQAKGVMDSATHTQWAAITPNTQLVVEALVWQSEQLRSQAKALKVGV